MIARAYRLHKDADVRRVRARGTSAAHRALVARILGNELEPRQNRYTVIAGKRCGKAVQRNRLKRLTREALRGYHPWLTPGHDVVIVCRGTVEEMPDLHAAQQSLARIFTKASLWTIPPGMPHGPPLPGESVVAGWSSPIVLATTSRAEPVQ